MVVESGQKIPLCVAELNRALAQYQRDERNSDAVNRIEQIVRCVRELCQSNGRRVTATRVGEKMGGLSKSGAIHWMRQAVSQGLIHYCAVEGWRVGPHVPRSAPAVDRPRGGLKRRNGHIANLHETVIEAAECVRRLSHDVPASIAAIAGDLGMSKRGARDRLYKAVSAGLICNVGKQLGWVPADQAAVKATMIETARCVCEIANGRPAGVEEIAKKLRMTADGARRRLKQAERAGMVVSAGYQKGWLAVS